MKISSNRGDMSLLETELSQSQNHTGIIHFTEPEVNIKTNLLIKCFFKISFFFSETTVLWVEKTVPCIFHKKQKSWNG